MLRVVEMEEKGKDAEHDSSADELGKAEEE